MPTDRTRLRGTGRVHQEQHAAGPSKLVLQHPLQHAPALIEDGLVQTRFLPFLNGQGPIPDEADTSDRTIQEVFLIRSGFQSIPYSLKKHHAGQVSIILSGWQIGLLDSTDDRYPSPP
jgi:hypothetical protein